MQISFLRNIVWLMSNLCRNKNPAPPLDKVKLMLPALAEFLRSDDIQILSKQFFMDLFQNAFIEIHTRKEHINIFPVIVFPFS